MESESRLFCNDNASSLCLNKIVKALKWKNENKRVPFDENARNSYDINTLATIGSNYLFVSIQVHLFEK